jgi:plastocyanin
MRRHGFALAVSLLLASASAAAGPLSVRIADSRGRPVEDAVVALVPRDSATVGRHDAPVTRVIDQKNLMFMPYVQVFRPGDAVVFRNSDRTRHHVYSFSRAKAFEFVLAPGQRSPALTLDNAGVVAVGCNIHDRMATYLYVSAAPWIAQSDHDGVASFPNLPPGRYTVTTWHPRLRPGRADARTTVVVTTNAPIALDVPLSLLPERKQQGDPGMLQY